MWLKQLLNTKFRENRGFISKPFLLQNVFYQLTMMMTLKFKNVQKSMFVKIWLIKESLLYLHQLITIWLEKRRVELLGFQTHHGVSTCFKTLSSPSKAFLKQLFCVFLVQKEDNYTKNMRCSNFCSLSVIFDKVTCFLHVDFCSFQEISQVVSKFMFLSFKITNTRFKLVQFFSWVIRFLNN